MSQPTNTAECPYGYSKETNNSSTKQVTPISSPGKMNLQSLKSISYFQDEQQKYRSHCMKLSKTDLAAIKQDITKVLTTSQEWWPADYGHYGPLMIRLAWHSAGTYRTFDGRGGANTGNMRFTPLDSWPDNGNLDKARRLLWPIKQKYGNQISWGDLIILTGNVALESMGFQPLGFALGRVDCWEPEQDVYWGPETEMLDDQRHDPQSGVLEDPLAADHMGLIYVNPEGPSGVPDPLLSAKHIRDTFGRMAMNDEETVALIAGGHTFGKGHGASNPDKFVGPAPHGGTLEQQGFGWHNTYKSGKGEHTITSGLEGAWTTNPIQWDNGYFDNLFNYEWVLTEGPGGAKQWTPQNSSATVPDAHNPHKKHAPVMFTTDVALKVDPIYGPISYHFWKHPHDFAEAFAKAWYKLTHRDMGPHSRCLGPTVPPPQVWQDPLPNPTFHTVVTPSEIQELKHQILNSGLTIANLVNVAWASASTFRRTDMRGGANGARIRLAPQKDWAVNDPPRLALVLDKLAGIQTSFPRHVSMADLIVLGGCAAIEQAWKLAGHSDKRVVVPFTPGRVDATQESTNVESFQVLEPKVDGFRNFNHATPHQLVDRAHFLNLSVPEMTCVVGGLRVLNANTSPRTHVGVLTYRAETLTNDFFVNLLDTHTTWTKHGKLFEGRTSGTANKWLASEVDLLFGSHGELRAVAEYYACDETRFLQDFIAAWDKVMNLDRFDLERSELIRSKL